MQEVYLIEGEITVAPTAMAVTNVYDAPISIFFSASNITTSTLTQSMYDSLSISLFPTNVTFSSWLVQHFGCTNDPTAAPNADPDGDGQDNYAEFLAGTNPTTNTSLFRFISAVPEGNNVRLTWKCGGGRTNVLQSAPAPNGAWYDLSPNLILTGTGDITTNYVDTGAATNSTARYYRVRLLP
jgi:hypothetical protein